jgi:hypothetical protein
MARTVVSLDEQDIPDEGIRFLKRVKISPSTVKSFTTTCVSQVIKDNMPLKEVNVKYYRDIEEPSLEYLRIEFILQVHDYKEVLSYENRFFNDSYQDIVRSILRKKLDSSGVEIRQFHRHVMLSFLSVE